MTEMMETVADIVAVMRNEVFHRNGKEDTSVERYVRRYADRIEAAWQREKGRTATPRQNGDGGNAAKLREVLEQLAYMPEEDLQSLEKTAKFMEDQSIYGAGSLKWLIACARNAKDALAALEREEQA